MYATKDDILKRVPERTLIELTDDNAADLVDEAKVSQAIADATALIDSYCAARYSLPLSPVPAVILMYAVDIAIYNLYSLRPQFETPEAIKDRNSQALKYLVKVAEGSVGIGAESTAPASVAAPVFISGPGRMFSRDRLRNC